MPIAALHARALATSLSLSDYSAKIGDNESRRVGVKKGVLIERIHEVMAEVRCVSVDFEVKGKVQGVFFRKFTKQEADKLKLNGWVENQADKNTVKGTIIGPEKSISAMKLWLKTKGSPKSTIASATFTNEQAVKDFKYTEFDIKR